MSRSPRTYLNGKQSQPDKTETTLTRFQKKNIASARRGEKRMSKWFNGEEPIEDIPVLKPSRLQDS